MGIDLGQLVFLIVGALLTLTTTWITNRQAMSNSLVIARDQRVFDLRREAFKGASDAWDVVSEIRHMDKSTISVRTISGMDSKVLDPIFNARMVFGLTTTKEQTNRLIDVFFAPFEGSLDARQFDDACSQLVNVVSEHYREIRNAWQRTLEGK
jgi:hypothetical protein